MPDRSSLVFHRDFRLFWGGVTLSQFATHVTIFALPLLAVTALHATPLQVGLVTAASTTAFLLIGLPAGAWVDRMRRRNLLIAGDIGRAVLLGSLPLAASMDALTLNQLYVVALGNGVLSVFFDVADQSYLPYVVGRERLVEGNSRVAATYAVADVSGPGIGGLLAQALTVPYALLVIAVNYVLSAASITAIRGREPKPERLPERHLGREIREGLRFVLGNRLLRAIAACTGTLNFFSAMTQTMLMVLLAGRLGLSAGTVGLFFTLAGLGGAAGASIARRVAGRIGQGPAIWVSVAVTAPFGLLVPLAGPGWRFWVAAAGLCTVAFGGMLYNVVQLSFRQQISPERMLGRMNATMRFIVWGTLPLGGVVGGALGSTIGVRPTLWIAAVGGTLGFLHVFLSPLRRMRELPTYAGEESAASPI